MHRSTIRLCRIGQGPLILVEEIVGPADKSRTEFFGFQKAIFFIHAGMKPSKKSNVVIDARRRPWLLVQLPPNRVVLPVHVSKGFHALPPMGLGPTIASPMARTRPTAASGPWPHLQSTRLRFARSRQRASLPDLSRVLFSQLTRNIQSMACNTSSPLPPPKEPLTHPQRFVISGIRQPARKVAQ